MLCLKPQPQPQSRRTVDSARSAFPTLPLRRQEQHVGDLPVPGARRANTQFRTLGHLEEPPAARGTASATKLQHQSLCSQHQRMSSRSLKR